MTFTASNGAHVDRWGRTSGDWGDKEIAHEARAEFYESEKDVRLGRERYSEHPQYVVYPAEELHMVRVVDEATGRSYYESMRGWIDLPIIADAVKKYRENNPIVTSWTVRCTTERCSVVIYDTDRKKGACPACNQVGELES